MTNLLSGYRTYITAAIAILTAIGAYASGDATLIQAAQLALTGALGAFLRAAK